MAVLAIRHTVSCAFAMASAVLLSGCLETVSQPQARVEAAQQFSIAPRAGVSPGGATIAFLPLKAAPEAFRRQLGDAMTAEVARNRMRLAAPASANYLIQGHILPFPAEKATPVAIIWDIYGADRRHRYRVEDRLVIPGVSPDGWSLLGEKKKPQRRLPLPARANWRRG
ncbi:MAG: hypothetical protein AB7F96_10260 [Beijerinckiaceae bacterium]